MARPFFEGRRIIRQFEVRWPKNGYTYGTVEEQWVELLSRSIDCGSKNRYTVTRTRGMSREDKRELQATVEGSFGLGMLTELLLQLKGTMSTTLTFEEEESEQHDFEFAAPDCYQRSFRTYQLQQIISLNIEWRKLFGLRRHRCNHELRIWKNDIHQDSEIEPRHERCGCRGGEEDTGRVAITAGPISLIDPFFITGNKLDLTSVGITVINGSVRAVPNWVGNGEWSAPQGRFRGWNDHDATEALSVLFGNKHLCDYDVMPFHIRYLAWVNDTDPIALHVSPVPDSGRGQIVDSAGV